MPTPGPNPILIILLGFILVLLGMVLPGLMVLKIIPSTFFLNFFSFGATFAGLLLGVVGVANYSRFKRK